jgi:hypothetical protein
MKLPRSFPLQMTFRMSLSDYLLMLKLMHLSRPAARHIIIDQQRMKERLGVIVRAKEG